MTRAFASIASVALLPAAVFGQATAFDAADVRVSPRSTWAKTAAI